MNNYTYKSQILYIKFVPPKYADFTNNLGYIKDAKRPFCTFFLLRNNINANNYIYIRP